VQFLPCSAEKKKKGMRHKEEKHNSLGSKPERDIKDRGIKKVALFILFKTGKRHKGKEYKGKMHNYFFRLIDVQYVI
jgi:hypothetical protein